MIIVFQNKLYWLYRFITLGQLHDMAGSYITLYMGNSCLMRFNSIYNNRMLHSITYFWSSNYSGFCSLHINRFLLTLFCVRLSTLRMMQIGFEFVSLDVFHWPGLHLKYIWVPFSTLSETDIQDLEVLRLLFPYKLIFWNTSREQRSSIQLSWWTKFRMPDM